MVKFNHMDNDQNFNDKTLKFSYWYLTHKILLRKLLIIFLIVLSVIFFAYAIYIIVLEFAVYGQNYNQVLVSLPQNLLNTGGYRALHEVKEPQVVNITVIAGTSERYDFISKIKNPNSDFLVESFDYQFITGNDDVDLSKDKSGPNPARVKKGFILPGEEKYLVDLSVTSKKRINQARLNIVNIQWRRISDYATIQKEKLRFDIADVKFIPPVADGSNKLPVSKVSFNAINKSAFNFWNIGFYVILFKGTAIAGANYVSIDQFLTGQTRPITVNWFEPLPDITQVQVVPEVNILDSSIYMELMAINR
jgi:hypothetical protein